MFINIFNYSTAAAYILIYFALTLSTNFIRMERQRREDELKNRSSKKALDAEQSILNRVWDHLL
jgi:hypothetical protein